MRVVNQNKINLDLTGYVISYDGDICWTVYKKGVKKEGIARRTGEPVTGVGDQTLKSLGHHGTPEDSLRDCLRDMIARKALEEDIATVQGYLDRQEELWQRMRQEIRFQLSGVKK